jgi:hypothetical protein
MSYRRSSLVALLFLVSVAGLNRATAGPPDVKTVARQMTGQMIPLLGKVPALAEGVEWARFLDKLTEQQGEAELTSAGGAPVLEKLKLVAQFRVPDVVVQDYLTNTICYLEVPGRRIATTIRIDCQVECSLDLKKVKVERDPDHEDTLTIVLPELEIRATIPKGTEYHYDTDYGGLRSQYLDSGTAKELRERTVRKAEELAEERFRQESHSAFRSTLTRELQESLRKQLAPLRVHIK